MSATNGVKTTEDPIAELKRLRAEIRVERARTELARLKRNQKGLQEANIVWQHLDGHARALDRMRAGPPMKFDGRRLTEDVTVGAIWNTALGYSDLLDLFHTADGRLLNTLPSTVNDRRYGAYWPHWRTWMEHSLLRAMSRIIFEVSDIAKGAINGLTNYVVGEGFKHTISARKGRKPIPDLVDVCQDFIDVDFVKRNALSSLERELFRRGRRDGEWFCREFPVDDGLTDLRIVEPEAVMDCPTLPIGEGLFGVISPPNDIEGRLGYWVCYEGNPSLGELVKPDEMVHVRVNVDRTIKRGFPDFVYETYQGVKSAGRCIGNMIEGAAAQAAICEIRQHTQALSGEVQSFGDSQADFQTPNLWTGSLENNEQRRGGTRLDIPKNFEYVQPPFSAGGASWIAIAQTSLQKLGVRWNAPQWLTSGDTGQTNYASALVAESPFVRNARTMQADNKEGPQGGFTELVRRA